LACKFDGCTVGETGVCALERNPETCEHRINAANEFVGKSQLPTDATEGDGIGSPVLERPASAASFSSSQTLGPDTVSSMMASRYVTIVGILGDPDSGKTACLASIYLLISNAMLKGWTFADSKSLMGFEDIARGAREWNAGSPPSQMTMHTEMADERRAGFLHLRLVRQSDGRRVDLALPDLPGEWTTKLMSSAQFDRFEFMKAAEVIWFVVDGRALADDQRRQGLITRVGQLGGRLKTMFGDHLPRVVIVVTHRDGGELKESVSARLMAELQRKEVEATITQVAPFSDSDAVSAGFGIADLVDATVGLVRPMPEFWPDSQPREGSRSFIRYRRNR
jgi:hypothetical protein